jgi:hypothetical protein
LKRFKIVIFFFSRKEIQNVDKDGALGKSLALSLGGTGRVYGIEALKNSCPRGTSFYKFYYRLKQTRIVCYLKEQMHAREQMEDACNCVCHGPISNDNVHAQMKQTVNV